MNERELMVQRFLAQPDANATHDEIRHELGHDVARIFVKALWKRTVEGDKTHDPRSGDTAVAMFVAGMQELSIFNLGDGTVSTECEAIALNRADVVRILREEGW